MPVFGGGCCCCRCCSFSFQIKVTSFFQSWANIFYHFTLLLRRQRGCQKTPEGCENLRQLCKPEMKSSVCITVLNSPNPSSVYIRLCKHGKKVFYCFYKITSSKNYNVEKDFKKFIFLIKMHLPTTLTMAFLNWPIKTYISKSGDGVFTTPVSLHHTTMFTYSHATTPLGQSERVYYLGYFIK